MPYREQPLDLLYRPARYPTHNYTGTGSWSVLQSPDGVQVGVLSWTGDPMVLCWFSDLAPDSPAYGYRQAAEFALAAGAVQGSPARSTRDALLASLPFQDTQTGDLADLRRELMW